MRAAVRANARPGRMSFAVRAGQVTGFVGPNGEGKSTTLRVISGLDTRRGKRPRRGWRYQQLRHPLTPVVALLDACAVRRSRSARTHPPALAGPLLPRSERPSWCRDRFGRARVGGSRGWGVLARDAAAARDRRGNARRPRPCWSWTSHSTAWTPTGCASRFGAGTQSQSTRLSRAFGTVGRATNDDPAMTGRMAGRRSGQALGRQPPDPRCLPVSAIHETLTFLLR